MRRYSTLTPTLQSCATTAGKSSTSQYTSTQLSLTMTMFIVSSRYRVFTAQPGAVPTWAKFRLVELGDI